LSCTDFAALAQFQLAVDLNIARRNHGLCFTAAAGKTHGFQERIERNEFTFQFKIDAVWHVSRVLSCNWRCGVLGRFLHTMADAEADRPAACALAIDFAALS